jgi:hypothetical protein
MTGQAREYLRAQYNDDKAHKKDHCCVGLAQPASKAETDCNYELVVTKRRQNQEHLPSARAGTFVSEREK